MGENFVLGASLDQNTEGFATYVGADSNNLAQDGKGWRPLGGQTEPFTGVFDGAGHTISDLSIRRLDEDGIGLFGVLQDAQVLRLGIRGADIRGHDRVGGVAGKFLTGANNRLEQVSASGRIEGNDFVGGVLGQGESVLITESFSTGEVFGDTSDIFHVGGLAGSLSLSTVRDSYSIASVNRGALLVGRGASNFFVNVYAAGAWRGPSTTEVKLYGGDPPTGAPSVLTNTFQLHPADTGPRLRTRFELQSVSTFTTDLGAGEAWDFDLVWTILPREGSLASFPYLRGFDYDAPGAEPAVNPLPGLGPRPNFAAGVGSIANPFIVENWHHLDNIRLVLDAHIRLNNDLGSNSAGYETTVMDSAGNLANDGLGWDPIGGFAFADRFIGVFDGAGHTIRGLRIAAEGQAGLFGSIRDARLENIHLEDVEVFSSGNTAGALVAFASSSRIIGSSATGSVESMGTSSAVGGLVGNAGGTLNDPLISSSFANVSVRGRGDVGGLAGLLQNGVRLEESFASGSVEATGSDANLGGLVGRMLGSAQIRNAYATSGVTNSDPEVNVNAGGLVGGIFSSDVLVDSVYAAGVVSNAGGGSQGGLIATVSGTTPSVGNAFWDAERSNQPTSAGGVSKTTAEMRDLATFTTELGDSAWDFDSIWGIISGEDDFRSYPFLQSISYDDLSSDIAATPFPGLILLSPLGEWLDDFGFKPQQAGVKSISKGGRLVSPLEAFLLGNDPNDSSDMIRPVFSKTSEAAQLKIEFNALTGREYTIESSTDLVNWSAVASAIRPDVDGQITIEISMDETAEREFYRVRVSIPER